MALILSTTTSSKTWNEGTQYSFDIELYSTTQPWHTSQVTIIHPDLVFTGYTVKSGPPPKSINNSQLPAGTTGLNKPLSFVADFNGAPFLGAPHLVVTVYATGKPNQRGSIKVPSTGRVALQDESSHENKTQTDTINLAGVDGVSAPPSIPTKLKAVPVGPIAIQLTWKKSDLATSIVLERDLDDAFGAPTTWTIGSDPGQYLDLANDESGTLTPDLRYFYRIKAVNSLLPDGTDWSNNEDALTPPNPPVPPAPTNLQAAKATKSTVKVTWKSIPNLKIQTEDGKATLTPTYQVQVGTTLGGPYTAYKTYRESITNLTVENLSPNTTYYFVVKASYLEAPGVVSVNSNEGTAHTDNVPGLPLSPTSFTATPGSTPTTIGNMVLTWVDTNNGNASYIIGRSLVSGGPFPVIVTTSNGATTFTDVGLTGATHYFYQIFAKNDVGPSNVALDDATTDTPPLQPSLPVDVVATTLNDSQIAIDWNYGNLTHEDEVTFRVLRGTAQGGPYTQIAELPYINLHYVDVNLTQNTTFYYVVRAWNAGGESGDSAEVTATTQKRSVTQITQSGFSANPLARTMVKQIGGRAYYASDRDRAVVWIAGCWFKAALKSHLTAPTATKTTGGSLEPDTYKISSKLLRSRGKTRSEFSPVEEIEINDTNNRLRIAPELDTTGSVDVVACRDTGFDIVGATIPGADYVEIYIAASGTTESVLLTTIAIDDPIWDSPGYYEVPADLDQAQLFNNNRRPMEKLGECSLPPACSVVVPFGPRMYAFGETNLIPTDAEITAGAELSLASGARTFTVDDYDLPEASIYHELWINNAPTGWFVYDTEDDTGYIRNADPTKDAAGWEGIGGAFTSFFFSASPSRMYASAFYSGEAGGLPTYSPECYPPLTVFDRELFPDDNTDPVAAIVINDSLLIGKPSKWVLARGGSNLGFPNLQFESISTGSGINSPRTLVKDSQDRAYYLGDTGPFRVTPAGVEKINVNTGNQRLFENVFDIVSVPEANAAWFSREDWYICASLDLAGNSGRKDGFVLDLKNNVLIPFSLPMRITWMEEVKNTTGTYQIDFGDDSGRSGILFKDGLSTDGIDYSLPVPSAFSTPIKAFIKSAILDTENRIGIRSFQPSMRVSGGTVECSFSVIRKDRMDDPNSEQIVESYDFDTEDKRNRFDMVNHSFPNAVVRMDFQLPVNPSFTRLEFKDIAMEVVRRGPIQRV